jgi:hypothetical protein
MGTLATSLPRLGLAGHRLEAPSPAHGTGHRSTKCQPPDWETVHRYQGSGTRCRMSAANAPMVERDFLKVAGLVQVKTRLAGFYVGAF